MTEKQMLTEDTPLLCNGKGDSSKADLKPSFRFGAFAAGTGSAVLYLVASSSLIMTNKYLMDPRRFPFAPTLTALHQLGTFILALLLWLAWPSLFPAANNIFASVHEKGNCDFKALLNSWLPYAPTGALFAVALVTSNQAYGYASVAFLQMMKEGFVLIVYVMSAAVGLEALRCRSLVVLVFVTICAATAVYGEVHFSWYGFWLQLTAGFCESAKIVIFSWLMRGKAKADSLSVVLFSAPATLIALLPLQLAMLDRKMLTQLVLWWPQLLGSVFIAFLLQIATAMAIQTMNGTGFGLTSVFKDVSIIVVAGLLFGDSLTMLQVWGFLGSVTGIGLYTYMKQFPAAFEPKTTEATKRSTADEETG